MKPLVSNSDHMSRSTHPAVASMRRAFESASRNRPEEVRTAVMTVGGRPVKMTVVGSELAERIGGAFSHLPRRLQDDSVELRIELWDGATTDVPPPSEHLRDVFERTWPFGRSVLASSSDERTLGYQSFGSHLMYDRRDRRIVGWFAGHSDLSLFELGKPLQPLLFAWHSDNDTVPVHAGFVSREGRGALLGGSGGSGKSTTCLLSLHEGLDYLGDDYIGIPPRSGSTFTGYSFYNSTWLEPNHIGRLPWLEPHAHRGSAADDKYLVLLDRIYPGRLVDHADVAVILLPRVTGERNTSLRDATPREAVLRLAPSSILQLPFITPGRALERISEVAESVPAMWLELGTDFRQIPERVEEAIKAGRA